MEGSKDAGVAGMLGAASSVVSSWRTFRAASQPAPPMQSIPFAALENFGSFMSLGRREPLPRCRSAAAVLSIVIVVLGNTVANAELPWPQFRGPDGQGHAAAQDLPLAWSETNDIAWK